MEGQFLERRQRAPGILVPLLRELLDTGAVDRDDPELSGDEEPVSDDER